MESWNSKKPIRLLSLIIIIFTFDFQTIVIEFRWLVVIDGDPVEGKECCGEEEDKVWDELLVASC
jgi:hypothetical protein